MKISSKKIEKKKKLLVVDDHPIVRRGLIELIDQERDLVVMGEAEDGPQAIELLKKGAPDLALVDLSLKGMSGLDLIKYMQHRNPDIPVLVFSMLDESVYAERVLRAGARGYVMKQEGMEVLLKAIRRVLSGEVAVSQDISSKVLNRLAGTRNRGTPVTIENFSDRELEVFRLIGRGVGTRQIAEQLCISVKTVETHRLHIKEKLNLEHAPELIRQAVVWVSQEENH